MEDKTQSRLGLDTKVAMGIGLVGLAANLSSGQIAKIGSRTDVSAVQNLLVSREVYDPKAVEVAGHFSDYGLNAFLLCAGYLINSFAKYMRGSK